MLFCSSRASAQEAASVDSAGRGIRIAFGGMASGVLTRASPAYDGQTFTELQLVQPVGSAAITRGNFTFLGMLNGEGFTLRRGELNAGIYGEGYVDRRHPHTLVHEAIVTWMPRAPLTTTSTNLSMSVSAGRGFVPFGSDDPMMRPLEKYPVNHHHAQILERVQGIVAMGVSRNVRSARIEAALFNGDEPAGPFHGPRWNRVGDSWSVRATLNPIAGLELSASEASVTSPELQQGGAFDHRQHHLGVRFDGAATTPGSRYVLAEWARTDEQLNGRTAFQYRSALIEGAYGWRGALAAARIERTERGEQNRLADPFRSPVGHVDFQILGVTQWTVATVAVQSKSFSPLRSFVRFAPFAEVSRATAASRTRPAIFQSAAFYGADRLWSVSLGVRIHTGTMRSRMGRYGIMGSADANKAHRHGM